MCYLAVDIIRIKMKIDDSLDVFAVHGVGGMIGTVLCAWLMQSQLGGVGLDEGKSVMDHIKIQGYGVFVTGLWTIVVTFLILKIISMFSDLRVTEDEELEGLDTSLHGESGYNN